MVHQTPGQLPKNSSIQCQPCCPPITLGTPEFCYSRLLIERNKGTAICKRPTARQSLPPWMTILHLIRAWRPSICHRAFGLLTLYVLLWMVYAHLRTIPSGSTLARLSLVLLLGTRIPVVADDHQRACTHVWDTDN